MERQVQSLKLETFADGVLLSNPGDPEQQTVFVSKDLIDILIKWLTEAKKELESNIK